MESFKGKVILITGASKGLGADMAKTFAAKGAKVILNYSSSQLEAENVLAEINRQGGDAFLIKADVSKDLR
jgi:3-oxoacyl-[acyl-carrier protein] reductase